MKPLTTNKGRELTLVCFSFLITLSLLILTQFINDQRTRDKMLEGAIVSSRMTDGARNLFVLNGRSGYIGLSSVRAEFLSDGFVRVYGINRTNRIQWKKLSTVQLDPGEYSLDGLSYNQDEVIKLQLNYSGGEGERTVWHYHWDREVIFFVEEEKNADLYIMVYPNMEIDELIRPTLYYNEKQE